MGIFSKNEVVVLKESSDARDYLVKLESLQNRAPKNSNIYKDLDKEILMVKAGIIGEDAILFELKNSGKNLVVLHDIMLKAPSGNTAQIDYYVITPNVNLIIECKNLYGNIEINENGDFIRTISYGGKRYKEGIYSPITQNERHLQVLKECKLDDAGVLLKMSTALFFEDIHKTLVVLANPKTVVNDKSAKKEVKEQVIRADQLIKWIKEIESTKSLMDMNRSLKEMIKHGEVMLERNIDERIDYSEKYEKWLQELEASNEAVEQAETKEPLNTTNVRTCPRCGGSLVLRTSKKESIPVSNSGDVRITRSVGIMNI